jgi:hypothetical protein
MDLTSTGMPQAPVAVEIDVDELVLIGFPPIDRRAVAEAFRKELAILLVRQGLDRGARADDGNTPMRPFPVASESQARDVGKSAAESVFERLRR